MVPASCYFHLVPSIFHLSPKHKHQLIFQHVFTFKDLSWWNSEIPWNIQICVVPHPKVLELLPLFRGARFTELPLRFQTQHGCAGVRCCKWMLNHPPFAKNYLFPELEVEWMIDFFVAIGEESWIDPIKSNSNIFHAKMERQRRVCAARLDPIHFILSKAH